MAVQDFLKDLGPVGSITRRKDRVSVPRSFCTYDRDPSGVPLRCVDVPCIHSRSRGLLQPVSTTPNHSQGISMKGAQYGSRGVFIREYNAGALSSLPVIVCPPRDPYDSNFRDWGLRMAEEC